MTDYFFWDIENVSFHNLDAIMKHVNDSKHDESCYVIYAKIKEARKEEINQIPINIETLTVLQEKYMEITI